MIITNKDIMAFARVLEAIKYNGPRKETIKAIKLIEVDVAKIMPNVKIEKVKKIKA